MLSMPPATVVSMFAGLHLSLRRNDGVGMWMNDGGSRSRRGRRLRREGARTRSSIGLPHASRVAGSSGKHPMRSALAQKRAKRWLTCQPSFASKTKSESSHA